MLKRHVLWWMLVLLMICNTFITMSISIAIVSMVNNRNTSVEAVSQHQTNVVCPNTTFILREFFKNENSSSMSRSSFSQKTGYDWSETEQNMVLSGFFRLNYLSTFPGGILAHKYGSKLIVGCTQFAISAMSFLIPTIAAYGPEAVTWFRAVQGLLSTITAPTALFTILGNWSPPQERGTFGTSFTVGIGLGEAFGSFLFGYIAEYIHWKYVYHLAGVCGMIWCMIWYMLIYDSPRQHPTISIAEKDYIENSLKQTSQNIKKSIPWRKIFTNVPFIICLLSANSAMWAFMMLNTYSPLYLKTVYGMNANEIGIISSVPYFAMIALALVIAYYCELFVDKGWLSILSIRKICTFLGCVVVSMPMIIIAFTKCNLTLVICCILFMGVVRVFTTFGAPLGVLDLSPKFCGILEGIVSTSSAVHLSVFSSAVNYFTKIWDISEMWKVVFLFTGLYCISTNMVYVIFGSSEVQSWNFEEDCQQNRNSEKMSEKELKTLLQN